jgi:hypothetical protein
MLLYDRTHQGWSGNDKKLEYNGRSGNAPVKEVDDKADVVSVECLVVVKERREKIRSVDGSY